MIIIAGIGWIGQKEYGSVVRKIRQVYSDQKSLYSLLQQESIFSSLVKNFGRFDSVTKNTCSAVALALYDAKIKYANSHKENIGIVGTNESGCLKSNLNYFRDYVHAGRSLARGNLFIYTLPSSPLAEAAIYFGFQGPLLYVNFAQNQIPSLLHYASRMLNRQEAEMILATKVDETGGICFVLKQEDDQDMEKLCFFEKVIAHAEKISNTEELILSL